MPGPCAKLPKGDTPHRDAICPDHHTRSATRRVDGTPGAVVPRACQTLCEKKVPDERVAHGEAREIQ